MGACSAPPRRWPLRPKAAQKSRSILQTAAEMLILAAKGQRPLMFAAALLAATGSGYMIALYMAGIPERSRSTL
jgi:hypothetical protein